MIALKPGSDIREMYTTVPFAITFKVYLFNVTNPVEVTRGGKPQLQEVGPYIFEWVCGGDNCTTISERLTTHSIDPQ